MCTEVDWALTKIVKGRLKSSGNVAWKIVEVKDDDYYAPMAFYHKYERKNRNVDREQLSNNYTSYVYEGVFHMFSCRSIGREVLKELHIHLPEKKLKLIKVTYSKRDFYCAGENVKFAWEYNRIWEKFPKKAICVKAFKFAE